MAAGKGVAEGPQQGRVWVALGDDGDQSQRLAGDAVVGDDGRVAVGHGAGTDRNGCRQRDKRRDTERDKMVSR